VEFIGFFDSLNGPRYKDALINKSKIKALNYFINNTETKQKCIECDGLAYYGLSGGMAILCYSHRNTVELPIIRLIGYQHCCREFIIDSYGIVWYCCRHPATFYSIDDPKGYNRRCLTHKKVDDFNKRSAICNFVDKDGKRCLKVATFKNPVTKKKETCGEHKKEGFVFTRGNKCTMKGCEKSAHYSEKEKVEEAKGKDIIPIYCSEHATDNSIKVTQKGRFCAYVDDKGKQCEIVATFKSPDGKKYCKAHSPKESVTIDSRKCSHPQCNKRPSYAASTKDKPTTCVNHAEETWICVTGDCKGINEDGSKCLLKAMYGKPDDKNKFCHKHKRPGDIDIYHKRCSYILADKTISCPTRACFGNKKDRKPLRCGKHKLSTDIYLERKICLVCKRAALYNIPDSPPEYCQHHKTDDMVADPLDKKEVRTKICELCNINKVNIVESYCIKCSLVVEGKNKTEKRKAKEKDIANFLAANGIDFNHDVSIPDSDIKYRPDFLLEFDNHSIIIEVDEYQHRSKAYAVECECVRMKNIYIAMQTYRLKNPSIFPKYNPDTYKLLFIRFNPDDYIVKDYVKLSLEDRKMTLLKHIEANRNRCLSGNKLSVIYLFYDYHNPNDTYQGIDLNVSLNE
jgi:hypothetical protein